MKLADDKTYRERVYEIVRQVPRGRVMTYGQIAEILGEGYTPRTVGYVMHGADTENVPWQRVINSQGKISPRPGGAEKQRILLEEEGVVFVKDKVDLKKYGWKGPDEADEPRQETLF